MEVSYHIDVLYHLNQEASLVEILKILIKHMDFKDYL